MSGEAIATMAAGMLLIWGGLAASVAHALRASRRRRDDRSG